MPPLGRGGDRFFDDNAWLGLALLRHFEVVRDPRALDLAADALAFARSGWAGEPGGTGPGGVRWRDTADSRSRHACSTAPAAALAVAFARHRPGEGLLDWGAVAYDWVRHTLRGPDALYADHVRADGRVDETRWSYNQGAMIGAGVLLHRATGDGRYLSDARTTAAAARSHFGPDALARQGPAFLAVYFRNLALLDPGGPWRAEAAAYADERWLRYRDPRTGLFAGDGSPLNAAAPMIEIYALLSGAPGGP